jgi:hypothetical protein
MKWIQITFLSVLMCAVLLPLMQSVIGFVEIRALDEKRTLAALPAFSEKIIRGDGRLAADINRWFDDRVGFRSLFIRLSHQIDYTFFDYAEKVLIGKDGWHYDRSMVDAKVRAERGGIPFQESIQRKFVAIADYLNRKNVRLIIVGNPDKITLLPQFAPAETPSFPSRDQFQKLREFLKQNLRWRYVDGTDVMPSCGGRDSFYRLDIHITSPAAFCLAEKIVSEIAVWEGRSAAYWRPHFTYYRSPGHSGGIASFMSLLIEPKEVYDVATSYHRLETKTPEGVFDQTPHAVFEWKYHSNTTSREGKLPAVILYGNSFADQYLGAGFHAQFSDTYRVRSNGIPIQNMLRSMGPDVRYVVFQFLESHLANLLAYEIPSD